MSDEHKWLRDKLERMDERLDGMSQTLARNTVSLEEHVKRTNLLESDVKPIKAHVMLVNTLAKIGSGGVAILVALKQLGLL